MNGAFKETLTRIQARYDRNERAHWLAIITNKCAEWNHRHDPELVKIARRMRFTNLEKILAGLGRRKR